MSIAVIMSLFFSIFQGGNWYTTAFPKGFCIATLPKKLTQQKGPFGWPIVYIMERALFFPFQVVHIFLYGLYLGGHIR